MCQIRRLKSHKSYHAVHVGAFCASVGQQNVLAWNTSKAKNCFCQDVVRRAIGCRQLLCTTLEKTINCRTQRPFFVPDAVRLSGPAVIGQMSGPSVGLVQGL